MLFCGWGANELLLFLIKLKIVLILHLLLLAFPAFSQDEIYIENGIKYDASRIPAFMQSLNIKNDFVIAFRTYFPGETESESKYFVLTGSQRNLKSYSYSGSNAILKNLNLSPESVDQIFKTFHQNDLFRIRNEKDIPNFCAKKYEIYESHTYEFTILSKGDMKILSYYSPEYYIEACYGISERQNIINAVAIINLLVPDY